MKSVSSDTYSRDYFLNCCDGFDIWKTSYGNKLIPRLEHALKLAEVKKGEKVLDVGCGRGEILIQLAKLGALAFGIDYAKSAIDLAKKSVRENKLERKVIVEQITSEKIPYLKNFFDKVFLLDVVEHLTPEQLQNSLKEINRVLKPDGKLFIHTAPNKDYWKGYKFFTRFTNFFASKLIWEPIFKTKLNYEIDPRNAFERKVHINEQTINSLKKSLNESSFKSKIFVDSSFRKINKGFWFQYTFLQPVWLPYLKNYFSPDLWAIAEKRLTEKF